MTYRELPRSSVISVTNPPRTRARGVHGCTVLAMTTTGITTPHNNPAYPARLSVDDAETYDAKTCVAQMVRALAIVHSYKLDPAQEHRRHALEAACAQIFLARGVTDPAIVFISEGMAWREALEMCELIGVPTALAG